MADVAFPADPAADSANPTAKRSVLLYFAPAGGVLAHAVRRAGRRGTLEEYGSIIPSCQQRRLTREPRIGKKPKTEYEGNWRQTPVRKRARVLSLMYKYLQVERPVGLGARVDVSVVALGGSGGESSLGAAPARLAIALYLP